MTAFARFALCGGAALAATLPKELKIVVLKWAR